VIPWAVRYFRDPRGRLPVADFFELPSAIGITKVGGYRCIVLLHAFKELRPRAHRRELPLARSRRDLVVAGPLASVDAAF
jgi:hypothetical protein